MKPDPQENPAEKLRKLLGAGASPLSRLPKKDEQPQPQPQPNVENIQQKLPRANSKTQIPRASKPDTSTGLSASPKPASVSTGSIFGPRFWTIASVISLTINGISLLALIIVGIMLLRFGLGVSDLLNMGNGLLGGLYTNFEKMDRASIQTNVAVDTTIPVKFDLQLNQTTNVVLSQDVTIQNALVTVNTGGLNITRANTTIVLPQGTTLPVVLNLTVPVDTTVPVTLNVPVDIPLSQTQLHEPFTGLQDVVRPFYCMINSGALNLSGEPVCK